MKCKRLISIIGLLLCMASSLCLFSACNDDTHTHNYTTEIVAPTCTEQGYTIYNCDCGNSYNSKYTSALGHNFVNYISNNDATYESDGTKTAICEREGCNVADTKIDIGSIFTHSHNYTTEIVVPTCTEQGYTIYTCACGDSYNANYIDELGHSFVSYISNNDATYESDGTKTAICERIGCNKTNTITDIGSILTHTHNYHTNVVASTCTEQGYTIYACACGNSYNADYVNKLGHKFVNYVSNNDATYESDGTKTAVCERTGCDVTDTKIDMGSILTHTHNYHTKVITPTCTERGYTIYACACGDSYNTDYVNKLGHKFVNYVSNNDATYESDGTKTAVCESTGCGVTDIMTDEGTRLISVDFYFNGYYSATVDTSAVKDYKIEYLYPTEPDITSNPYATKYFHGWFLDGGYNIPCDENTQFKTNTAIYGKWVYLNYLEYSVSGGEATITGISSVADKTTVVIPEYLNGFPVTNIGKDAFNDEDLIRQLVFYGTKLKTIYSYAFAYCSSLTIVSMLNDAIITNIDQRAFSDCKSLTSIDMPNSVTSIGMYAFSNCDSLTSVKIPSSVTSMSEYAFSVCDSLTNIDVDDNNQNYSSQDGIVYNKNKTEIIIVPEGIVTATISNGVTSIKDSAFFNYSSLTEVIIPNSVESIGRYVFYNCGSLTEVIIPNSVESIGQSAFYNCGSLTDITYEGTKTEWNAIYKENGWIVSFTGDVAVHCTDGIIYE